MDELLKFYFITDDSAPGLSAIEQVEIAIKGGATLIQYRNKSYGPEFLGEVIHIRELCLKYKIPFIINDHIDLAQKVMADGVHVGQDDESPKNARKILGKGAIVGVSVSNMDELIKSNLKLCNYIGSGPVFPTGTKADAKAVQTPSGFKKIAEKSPIPVVAIGGINENNAHLCFENGAAGVAVISCITRAANPLEAAFRLKTVCSSFGESA